MKEKWYAQDVNEVIKKLESNAISGITENEVDERIKKYGLNKLKEEKKKGIVIKFLEQFKDVMLIILIIAAILSAIVSVKQGEPMTDTIIILIVVFLNALLGVIQENKAEKAIEALKKMASQTIKVRREGKIKSVDVQELVPGDIVLLEAGDYVPADMRIIENHSLRAEESALTGESASVDKEEKVLGNDKKEVPLAERVNMLYSGSSIVYGRGTAIVTETGMNTELGKIAQAITNIDAQVTPLQKKMNEISKMLSVIVVMIAIVMVVMGIIQRRPILDVFMLAIALAVAAIPEGLATVITITLATGVQKMAKQKSIIRKMSAVEALGSTEVICSDKTGTLTQNKMTVRKLYFDKTLLDVTDLPPSNCSQILTKVMTLCNDTNVSIEDGKRKLLGDPTETALVSFCEKGGILKEEYDKKYDRVDEIPFDSERKLMTTVNKTEEKGYLVCTKGAIESILARCRYILIDDKVRDITSEDLDEIMATNLQMAKSALRVLGYAYKILDKKTNSSKEDLESSLIFIGMTGMIDPPRPEVKDAVKECFKAGMIPVMITGDNIDTASAIAKELGILNDGEEAVTGIEVDNMTDDELKKRVNKIRVYARVSPDNKIRIVNAWKANGKTVAMTGDGVNDAPALKGADIGVGMGITGTEVSKSVSSMVLADDNFATIVVAVKEGRRIYTNIQNVITYLLASNIAEVIIIFFATLFNKVVFLPIQILWINLISDTLPAIALGFEKEEEDIMNRKPRSAKEKFFNNFMVLRIIIPAIIKSVAVFISYYIGTKLYNESVGATSVFFTLAIIESLFAFICRSDKHTVFKIGLFKNIPMLLCMIGTIILQILIMSFSITRQWFDIEKISLDMYGYICLIIAVSLILLEITKVVLAKIFKKA